MNEFTTEDYKKFKQEQGHKIHGWFLFGKPALSINDVDLIKQIQVLFLFIFHFQKYFSGEGKDDTFILLQFFLKYFSGQRLQPLCGQE